MSKNDSDKLDELILSSAIIKEQLAELKTEVNLLNKHVFIGNGKPSILSRVEVTESLLDEITWFRRAAIAGFCTSVVSVGIALVSFI